MRLTSYRPPHYPRIPEEQPVVFLEGPLHQPPHWQAKAIEAFSNLPDDEYDMAIINPLPQSGRESNSANHIDWVNFYFDRATRLGGVLFWFSGAKPNDNSQVLFGEVIGALNAGRHINAVAGFDKTYGGPHKFMRKRAEELSVPVHKSLSVACRALLEIIESDL